MNPLIYFLILIFGLMPLPAFAISPSGLDSLALVRNAIAILAAEDIGAAARNKAVNAHQKSLFSAADYNRFDLGFKIVSLKEIANLINGNEIAANRRYKSPFLFYVKVKNVGLTLGRPVVNIAPVSTDPNSSAFSLPTPAFFDKAYENDLAILRPNENILIGCSYWRNVETPAFYDCKPFAAFILHQFEMRRATWVKLSDYCKRKPSSKKATRTRAAFENAIVLLKLMAIDRKKVILDIPKLATLKGMMQWNFYHNRKYYKQLHGKMDRLSKALTAKSHESKLSYDTTKAMINSITPKEEQISDRNEGCYL